MRIEVMELHCMLDNTAKIDISHWAGNENDRTKRCDCCGSHRESITMIKLKPIAESDTCLSICNGCLRGLQKSIDTYVTPITEKSYE